MVKADSFIELAYTLISIRDLNKLLDTMLARIRGMLQADAGSIFIFDEDNNELIFKYAQNDSVYLPFRETAISVDDSSIAGYSAARDKILRLDDVYSLGDEYPFHFNRAFDEMSGYRTKSVLVFPISDVHDRLIGVLQLINKKDGDGGVIPFDGDDEVTAYSLSGILGMVLENALLYDSIRKMWEGFIKASMTAIDLRDRATAGHSERVTKLTMATAAAMDRDNDVFPDFHMTPAELRALEYSCMLHDFGKLVISDKVMQKSEKLYPGMLDVIKYRFALAKTAAIAKGNSDACAELNSLLDSVVRANVPTLLDEETGQGLDRCLEYFFTDLEGNKYQLLTAEEYQYLSIRRGSLTDSERDMIMSHVKYTHDFLTKIPWTAELKQVPVWAAMHHERMDGKGYPFGLSDGKISMQGRIMAIADVYDALTAGDRPYKKAVPAGQAYDILKNEADKGALDRKIVSFFIDKKIYTCLDRREN